MSSFKVVFEIRILEKFKVIKDNIYFMHSLSLEKDNSTNYNFFGLFKGEKKRISVIDKVGKHSQKIKRIDGICSLTETSFALNKEAIPNKTIQKRLSAYPPMKETKLTKRIPIKGYFKQAYILPPQ